MVYLEFSNLYFIDDTGSDYEISSILFELDPQTDIPVSVESNTAPVMVNYGVDIFAYTPSPFDSNNFFGTQALFDASFEGTFSDGGILAYGDLYSYTWDYSTSQVISSSLVDTGYVLATESTYSVGDILDYGDLDTDAVLLCFAADTMIDTPTGPRPVQDLNEGDLVRTADGRAVPVQWMGHQSVAHAFAVPERDALVCVRAGALGPGLPVRDLTMTANHGLVIDEALINAGALVNGSTIYRVPRRELPDLSVVYHIETPDHSVVVANGCQAETYIDNDGRRHFDNFAEYVARFGTCPAPKDALALPRAKGPRQVPPAIRARIAARAATAEPAAA